MIEAQQQVIDTAPARKIMPTSADKGVTLYNRLVKKMACEEMG
jgi:vanillate O-demethylase monooxygenase subunit